MPAYVNMTPDRYQTALTTLRMSRRELARILGCQPHLTSFWGTGKHSVPPAVADWLLACVKIHERNPYPTPPRDWRRRDPRFSLKRRKQRAEAKARADNAALVNG